MSLSRAARRRDRTCQVRVDVEGRGQNVEGAGRDIGVHHLAVAGDAQQPDPLGGAQGLQGVERGLRQFVDRRARRGWPGRTSRGRRRAGPCRWRRSCPRRRSRGPSRGGRRRRRGSGTPAPACGRRASAPGPATSARTGSAVSQAVGVDAGFQRRIDQLAAGFGPPRDVAGAEAEGQAGDGLSGSAEGTIAHRVSLSAGAEVSSASACSSPPILPFSAA